MSASSPYPPAIVRWARDVSRRGGPENAPAGAVWTTATAHNRTCGDRVSAHLARDPDGHIVRARFDGEGCALCLAAAAALCEIIEGCTSSEAAVHLDTLAAALDAARDPSVLVGGAPTSDGLFAFVAVRPFPARHRCVTLPADAIAAALASSTTLPTT